jgi:hypothetical protein
VSKSLIVSPSLRHAIIELVIDRDWMRIRNDTFVSPDGEEVRYVPDAEGLMGLERGTRLYLGFGWRERHDYQKIRDLIRVGRFETALLPVRRKG